MRNYKPLSGELFDFIGKDGRVVDYADQILKQIRNQRQYLDEQESLWRQIRDSFALKVCPECRGEGRRLQFGPGDDPQDGPRNYKCPDCKGTGDPPKPTDHDDLEPR